MKNNKRCLVHRQNTGDPRGFFEGLGLTSSDADEADWSEVDKSEADVSNMVTPVGRDNFNYNVMLSGYKYMYFTSRLKVY